MERRYIKITDAQMRCLADELSESEDATVGFICKKGAVLIIKVSEVTVGEVTNDQ